MENDDPYLSAPRNVSNFIFLNVFTCQLETALRCMRLYKRVVTSKSLPHSFYEASPHTCHRWIWKQHRQDIVLGHTEILIKYIT